MSIIPDVPTASRVAGGKAHPPDAGQSQLGAAPECKSGGRDSTAKDGNGATSLRDRTNLARLDREAWRRAERARTAIYRPKAVAR